MNTPIPVPQLPQQNPKTCTRTPALNLPQPSQMAQPPPSEEGSNFEISTSLSPTKNGNNMESSDEESSSDSEPVQLNENADEESSSDSEPVQPNEDADEESSSESEPLQPNEDALQIHSRQPNQAKPNKEWTVDEDQALLSAFIMSGVDQLKGTSRTSSDKWVNIIFELARQEDPSNINCRNIEAIKSRWKRMNCSVKKWVDVYAEAKKQKGSSSSKADILAEAHRMYQGCSNGARFTFEHSWDVMKQYPEWQGSTNQFPYGSSGAVGKVAMGRPGGAKKDQGKGKEVGTPSQPNTE